MIATRSAFFNVERAEFITHFSARVQALKSIRNKALREAHKRGMRLRLEAFRDYREAVQAGEVVE